MLSVGWLGVALSSLTIVPMAPPSLIVAPVGADKVSLSVSLASIAVSPVTWTLMTFDVSPAAKVSVPVWAV